MISRLNLVRLEIFNEEKVALLRFVGEGFRGLSGFDISRFIVPSAKLSGEQILLSRAKEASKGRRDDLHPYRLAARADPPASR